MRSSKSRERLTPGTFEVLGPALAPIELAPEWREIHDLDRAKARAGQAYFGIDGNPGLARAFGLAIDLRIRFKTSQ